MSHAPGPSGSYADFGSPSTWYSANQLNRLNAGQQVDLALLSHERFGMRMCPTDFEEFEISHLP